MTILIFLIILSVLVVAHELGHFIAAKLSRVDVSEFGIGFPPKLARLFHWKGTDFTMNALLFGGFVRMAEEGERKIFVLISGVLANLVLAWVIFSIMFLVGINSGGELVQYGFFGSIWHGLLTTGKIIWLTVTALFHINPQEIVGPVGLVPIVGQVRDLGFSYLLYLTSLISINLAVINLIPLPALDGGRLLIVIFEKLRGQRISKSLFNKLNFVSFVLLGLLMVIVTARDITHLI